MNPSERTHLHRYFGYQITMRKCVGQLNVGQISLLHFLIKFIDNIYFFHLKLIKSRVTKWTIESQYVKNKFKEIVFSHIGVSKLTTIALS